MTDAEQQRYLDEISDLKMEYSEKIQIFCGLEYDMFSGIDIPEVDYVIGSVHGFMIGGKLVVGILAVVFALVAYKGILIENN